MKSSSYIHSNTDSYMFSIFFKYLSCINNDPFFYISPPYSIKFYSDIVLEFEIIELEFLFFYSDWFFKIDVDD